MNLLWLGIALLLLPALWFLSLPLRRSRTTHARQQQFETHDRAGEQNVAVYQQRLAALEAARERGEIEPARFEESRLELDRNLLEDTEARRRAPLRRPLAGRFMIPLVMVAVVIASTLGYRWIGAEGDLALYAAQQEVLNSPDGSLAMLIDRLEEQAARQPDNPKVWTSLFPLYRESGQLDQAMNALERVIELEGRRADLLAQLAQIKFFAADRTLTDEVQALVDETLDKDPRQPTVLGMLGIEAFDSGRYEQAIGYWRRAVAGFEDAESAAALQNGITVAQQRLAESVNGADAAGAVDDAPSLTLRVSLAQSLQDKASAGDTVFVVARDVAGELPPLAVERATVADLPLEVTLDDSDAMAPQARLSQVDEVRLIVRVSGSGEARPQPGDLFGETGPLPLADSASPVEVVIDQVVRVEAPGRSR